MFWRRKKPVTAETQASLRLESGPLAFTLVRSRRRSLGVQILKDGAVIVRAPRDMAEGEVARFLKEKSRWIERHRARLLLRRKPPLRYRDGDGHPWLGRNVRLEVERGNRACAELLEGTILVRVPDPADEGRVEKAVKSLLKREAGGVFRPRIEALFSPFAALGHRLPSLKTRWMKRNFGSMSRQGVLTLNLTLLRKPLELVDYVIIHELCHLEHMNHGRRFYALLDDMMPSWKTRKATLHSEVD